MEAKEYAVMNYIMEHDFIREITDKETDEEKAYRYTIYTDNKGNLVDSVKDGVKRIYADFENLYVSKSLPYRFWEKPEANGTAERENFLKMVKWLTSCIE